MICWYQILNIKISLTWTTIDYSMNFLTNGNKMWIYK